MILSTTFLVLFPIFKLACYTLLFIKRKELVFVKRNEPAIIVASLAGWLAYFTLAASISNTIPCGVIFVTSSFICPLSASPLLVRALLLRGKFESSKLVIEEEISYREHRQSRGLSTIPSGSEYRSGEGNKSTTPSNLVAASQGKKQSEIALDRAHNAANTTKWSLAVMLPILLILAWCVSSVEPGNSLLSTEFEDCKAEPLYFSCTKLLFDAVGLIMAIMACVIVRNIDDELFLNREITETAVLFILTTIVIAPIRLAGHSATQPLLQTIQQMILMTSMVIIPCCPDIKAIENVRSWLKHRINPTSKSAVPAYAQPLPVHRGSAARSSIHIPHKSIIKAQENSRLTLEAYTSWDAGLCILLSSEEGINSFTRHCAREFSSENILFWCAVNEYRAKFDDTKTTTIGDDVEHNNNEQQTGEPNTDIGERSIADEAQEIFTRFIDAHSSTQVNLSSAQVRDIKTAMDSNSLAKDTFDFAQKEIFSVMSRDSYPRFLASKRNRKPI